MDKLIRNIELASLFPGDDLLTYSRDHMMMDAEIHDMKRLIRSNSISRDEVDVRVTKLVNNRQNAIPASVLDAYEPRQSIDDANGGAAETTRLNAALDQGQKVSTGNSRDSSFHTTNAPSKIAQPRSSEQSSGLDTAFSRLESAALEKHMEKSKEKNNNSQKVVIRLSLEGLADFSRRIYWKSDITMEEFFQKVSSRFQGQQVYTLLVHVDEENILVESREQWEMLRKGLLDTGKETVDAEVRLKCV